MQSCARERKRKNREKCGEHVPPTDSPPTLSNGQKKSRLSVRAGLLNCPGIQQSLWIPAKQQSSAEAQREKGLAFSMPPYLDLLLKDLVVLLLLVQDMLLLCLLQSPLVHVPPVHLLELLTLLK